MGGQEVQNTFTSDETNLRLTFSAGKGITNLIWIESG